VHMRWFCGLMMFVAASLFARAALAHGVVGHCGCCFEALITQDPAPPDELDTLGSSSAKSSNANTYLISLSSEKLFYIDGNHVERFSIGDRTSWSHAATFEGVSHNGWDNLDMFAKLSPYSLEHDFLISFASHLQLPTGDRAGEEQNQASRGPTYLLDRGMGGLPNWRGLIADNAFPTHENGQAPDPLVQLEFGGWSIPVLLSRAAVLR
jgi:hypothetical protein